MNSNSLSHLLAPCLKIKKKKRKRKGRVVVVVVVVQIRYSSVVGHVLQFNPQEGRGGVNRERREKEEEMNEPQIISSNHCPADSR